MFCSDQIMPFLKQGLGTDDHTLIRIMVTRCEVDMVEIKTKFLHTYGKTLGSFIKVHKSYIFGISTYHRSTSVV